MEGQPVTLTAAVTPATATGLVQIFEGSGILGTLTLSGGSASLTLSPQDYAFPVGAHSLTVNYNGDANNAMSTSAVLTLTIVKRTATTMTLASFAESLRAGPGGYLHRTAVAGRGHRQRSVRRWFNHHRHVAHQCRHGILYNGRADFGHSRDHGGLQRRCQLRGAVPRSPSRRPSTNRPPPWIDRFAKPRHGRPVSDADRRGHSQNGHRAGTDFRRVGHSRHAGTLGGRLAYCSRRPDYGYGGGHPLDHRKLQRRRHYS